MRRRLWQSQTGRCLRVDAGIGPWPAPARAPARSVDVGGRQCRRVQVVVAPGVAAGPAQRALHRGARARRRFQHAQGQLQRQVLRCRVVRQPGRIAQRQVAEQQPRHTHLFDNVLGRAHDHRGNAGGLELPRHQRHRLVTHRAVGHQQGGIHTIGATVSQHLGCIHLQRVALAAICRHADDALRDLANAPLPQRAAQRRQREPGAAVVADMRAIDGHMRHAQVVVERAVEHVDVVELGCGVVRCAGTLLAQLGPVRRGGGKQGHAQRRQRLARRTERHLGEARIAVRRVAERARTRGRVAVAPGCKHRRTVPAERPVDRRAGTLGACRTRCCWFPISC